MTTAADFVFHVYRVGLNGNGIQHNPEPLPTRASAEMLEQMLRSQQVVLRTGQPLSVRGFDTFYLVAEYTPTGTRFPLFQGSASDTFASLYPQLAVA